MILHCFCLFTPFLRRSFCLFTPFLRQSFCLFTPQKTVHGKLKNGPQQQQQQQQQQRFPLPDLTALPQKKKTLLVGWVSAVQVGKWLVSLQRPRRRGACAEVLEERTAILDGILQGRILRNSYEHSLRPVKCVCHRRVPLFRQFQTDCLYGRASTVYAICQKANVCLCA